MSDIENSAQRRLTWASLLGRSYALYGEKFWAFFRIALLPALLVYLWRYIYRLVIHQMAVAGWIGFESGGFALLIATGWINGAFYWVVSTFFFAAVATAVLGAADEKHLAISDAFTQARARIGGLAAAAALCWTVFWLVRGMATYALLGVLDRLRLHPGFNSMVLILSLPSLLLVGLFARLALTVPALMDKTDSSLREALQSSIKKTEGWELFFMMFLVKSAIVGYGLYLLGDYSLNWLWQHGVLTQTTFPWAKQTLYICIAAALESPLFIAASILYRDFSLSRLEALPVAAIE